MATRKIAQWKKDAAVRVSEAIKTHEVVVSAELSGVRASQIHELRKRLRGRVEFIVSRNTIVKKSLSNGFDENCRKFLDGLTGSNILLFSRNNPFSLIILLEKNKVKVPAKAGDVATHDVIVPAGNTGLSPGPVIAEFGHARIPTRIEGGSIWVAKDTVVAKKGNAISAQLASLLSKLGVKPIEMGLTITGAYDSGLVLTRDHLKFDLGSYSNDVVSGARAARSISVEAEIADTSNIDLIVTRAFRNSFAVALESGYLEDESVPFILAKATAQAKSLLARVTAEKT